MSIDINKDAQLNESDISSILEILNGPEAEVNLKWLNDETENFCHERAIYNAVLESIQILDDKRRGKVVFVKSIRLYLMKKKTKGKVYL